MGIHTIRDTFREIVKRYDSTIIVEVQSVNFPFFNGIKSNGTVLENLMLVLEESDNGIYCIPKVGSNVLVAMLDDTYGFIIGYGEIDEVVLRGDQHGGLVKVSELVTKLNNIENDINTLKTAFSSWVVVPTDGGAALKAITATWYGSQLTQTTVNDLENDKVKHG